jgi:hypothetical protein
MKAIFLDIDGVIATPVSVRLNYLLGRGPERQWYDAVSLTYLGRLVERTGAVVVLSSNWRTSLEGGSPFEQQIMDNLFDQLAGAGAPVSDCTPHLPADDRSCEIGAWLDEHPCDSWVIFDDLASFELRPEVAEGHLVLIEESDGIRYQHFRRAQEILGEA